MGGKDKKYVVVYAVYDKNMQKDALWCGLSNSKGKVETYGSVDDARKAVFDEIRSYIERQDYDSDEAWEEAIKGCVWNGYETGNRICEEHCGIETVFRVVEIT